MERDATTLIIGTAGMLGSALEKAAQERRLHAVTIPGPQDLDITDAAAVQARLGDVRPCVVINAAGYTDVDASQHDPAAASLVNCRGPANLAAACGRLGALLVHFSTDYVFDGSSRRPYRPDDPPRPLNEYGRSKLAGEEAIRTAGGTWLTIRSSWMFAAQGRNFVRTILDHAERSESLSVVDDQRGRPTHAPDLAAATLDLIDAGARGLLHVANGGECTWFELAEATVACAGLECRVAPCTTSEQARPAARPAYSVLDCSLAEGIIGPRRRWRDALAECVSAIRAGNVATTSR